MTENFREVEAASSSLVTPIEKYLIITVMVVIRIFYIDITKWQWEHFDDSWNLGGA